jgi:hypothetical protein
MADIHPSGCILEPDESGAVVLAEGELTGHRHAIFDRVTMLRDEALARDIPSGLYVGGTTTICHQEHQSITLEMGIYHIRRQRELEPRDAQMVVD